MESLKVLIFVESRYKINRKRIKACVERTLAENDVQSVGEVSIAVIGDRKMKTLNKKYRGLDKTTNVLSFPQAEGERSVQPAGSLKFGDIVLSYPQVIQDAARDDMLVDDKIDQLVEHGMLHLLGLHHE